MHHITESLGARLRRRREEQDIALSTIAEQTKIKASLLEALERDDVSQWPAGIFRRAFVRAYAHAINLDPDVTTREFLEVHPDPVQVEAAAAIATAAGGAQDDSGSPGRTRSIMGLAMGSLARLRRGPRVENEIVPEPRAPIERPTELPVDPPPGNGSLSSEPDLLAVARLCTEFGRVDNTSGVKRLLQEAAGLLDASGLIVWIWDGRAAELKPALVHGYSRQVLAQLPVVRRDADNATAEAFRSASTCAIDGDAQSSGALAVPLMTPGGCAGVLAIELPHGNEQASSVRAVATIVAAMLAQLVRATAPA